MNGITIQSMVQSQAKFIALLFLLFSLFECSSPKQEQEITVSPAQVDDTLYAFSVAGKKGFKNSKGVVVIPPTYTEIFTDTFKNDVAFVLDTAFWAINKQGQKVIKPFTFDNGPDYVQEGLFRYIHDNKVGYANVNGEIVIKAKFSGAFPFKNNRAAVCVGCKKIASGETYYWQGGKWGYLDRTGKLIIDTLYSQASDFEDGRAVVHKNNDEFTIDTLGHLTFQK